MRDLKLSYEDIQRFVDHLSDEEFMFLKEAIYDRTLEETIEDEIDITDKVYTKEYKL